MLGLGNSITSGSVSSLPFSPEQVSGLVGWYDFTDADTVFQPDGASHSPITINKPPSDPSLLKIMKMLKKLKN